MPNPIEPNTTATDVKGYQKHSIKNKTEQPHIHKHGDVTGKMQRKYTLEKKNQRERVGQRIKKIIKKLSLLNISRVGGSHKGNQLLIEILNISSVSHKQTVHACVFLSMLGSSETTSVVCLLWLLFEQKRVKQDAWLSIINASLKSLYAVSQCQTIAKPVYLRIIQAPHVILRLSMLTEQI